MNTQSTLCMLGILSCLSACLGGGERSPGAQEWQVNHGADLKSGQLIAQSMLGVSRFESVHRSGGADPSVGPESNELEELPLIAGAYQEVLSDDWLLDVGLEGGAALGFVGGDGFVVAAGSGGLLVAVDIDLLLVDLFFGPFVSASVGRHVRFYAGAGPLLDFAEYSHEGQKGNTVVDEQGTGLGLGWYARGGFEVYLGSGYMLGLGYRWVDSSIALSGELGTLDLVGSQIFLSLSSGF